MRALTFVLFSLSSSIFALAQSPGPSPTNSVCHSHGDHWHCDAPKVTGASTSISASAVATSSVDPGPSPTNSVGCEPHDDHWHCDGPVTGAITSRAPAPTQAPDDHDHEHDHDEDEDEHDHTSGSGVLPASPTASDCHAHGDHWHCSPKTAALTNTALNNFTATVTSRSTLATSSSNPTGAITATPSPAAAGALQVGMSIVGGAAAIVALLGL